MTHPRTKILPSLLGALLALGMALPAAAQTAGSPTEAVQAAFRDYARLEETVSFASEAAVLGAADYQNGQISAAALANLQDRDQRVRAERNAARTVYTAAWDARRPQVPVGSNADDVERAVQRAETRYLQTLRARGVARAELTNARADLDAQRIDGAQLDLVNEHYLTVARTVPAALDALNTSWTALDGVYLAAIDAHDDAVRVAQANAARQAAERARAEDARRAAAERAAAARAEAEARRVAAAEAARRAAAEREAARVAQVEAARRAAAERAAAEAAARAQAEAEARVAWERARRQRNTVPTATAQNGQGGVVVRPTREGKSGEQTCPTTGASTGMTYSASVRVAIR
ncbi:MAG: hypothetical protein R3B82_00325 [Sandaracinaceae bacterium]